jgi:hypothetical protein
METFFKQSNCDRCGGSLAEGRIMSTYNHQCLCLKCKAAEEARGDYHVALEMEREAVKRGIRNYPGIGLGECFSDSLRRILPISQRRFIERLLNSPEEDTRLEGRGILEAAERQAKAFDTMPKTYEADTPDAIAYLHYFSPYRGGDWWITEKDMGEDGTGAGRQIQAFGLVRLVETELGFVSIEELQLCPYIELDFYWTPKSIRKIQEEIDE